MHQHQHDVTQHHEAGRLRLTCTCGWQSPQSRDGLTEPDGPSAAYVRALGTQHLHDAGGGTIGSSFLDDA